MLSAELPRPLAGPSGDPSEYRRAPHEFDYDLTGRQRFAASRMPRPGHRPGWEKISCPAPVPDRESSARCGVLKLSILSVPIHSDAAAGPRLPLRHHHPRRRRAPGDAGTGIPRPARPIRCAAPPRLVLDAKPFPPMRHGRGTRSRRDPVRIPRRHPGARHDTAPPAAPPDRPRCRPARPPSSRRPTTPRPAVTRIESPSRETGSGDRRGIIRSRTQNAQIWTACVMIGL